MNWISTIEPAPWRIAGYNLGPLLFGHCTLLERFDLSAIDDESDLHFFLGICSRDYQGAYNWITTQQGKPTARFDDFVTSKCEVFRYLHENMALPQTMESTEQGETRGSPFLQALRTTAITKLNYSPHLINESRFGQLVWDVLSYKEATGQTRIIDDYLSNQLAKLEELNAKV